jgi:hypothetical protein
MTRLRWTITGAGHRHVTGLPQFYVSRVNDVEWDAVVQGRNVSPGQSYPTGVAAQRAVEQHVAVSALLTRTVENRGALAC